MYFAGKPGASSGVGRLQVITIFIQNSPVKNDKYLLDFFVLRIILYFVFFEKKKAHSPGNYAVAVYAQYTSMQMMKAHMLLKENNMEIINEYLFGVRIEYFQRRCYILYLNV